ncbi:MAG TPA: hypothetical protein VK203_15050 [Nostocaceae cyanobacterium]|nr:hypothetical protein [Nostocaceae cyanobacterium]
MSSRRDRTNYSEDSQTLSLGQTICGLTKVIQFRHKSMTSQQKLLDYSTEASAYLPNK